VIFQGFAASGLLKNGESRLGKKKYLFIQCFKHNFIYQTLKKTQKI